MFKGEIMKIEVMKIDDLKQHPKNPRKHPESSLTKLEKSIKEYGWTNPVLASKDGYILAGHARTKAAKRLGIEEVPVLVLDLEGAKADAYLIADNKIQEETKWDEAILKDLIEELDTGEFDISITGFEEDEIEKLMSKFEDQPDEKPELEFTPELMEEHNYIVLYFDNSMDWQVAKERFGIKTMAAKWKDNSQENKQKRKGVGRVLKGADVLEMLK